MLSLASDRRVGQGGDSGLELIRGFTATVHSAVDQCQPLFAEALGIKYDFSPRDTYVLRYTKCSEGKRDFGRRNPWNEPFVTPVHRVGLGRIRWQFFVPFVSHVSLRVPRPLVTLGGVAVLAFPGGHLFRAAWSQVS